MIGSRTCGAVGGVFADAHGNDGDDEKSGGDGYQHEGGLGRAHVVDLFGEFGEEVAKSRNNKVTVTLQVTVTGREK